MALLEATGITKRFAGIAALSDVSIEVDAGAAVGLIGPNGAGKTTLFDCLYGNLEPDGGQVLLDGEDISRLSVHRRARLGLGRTFQRIELFSGMTPREHFLVAERARLGTGRLWRDVIGRSAATADERARAEATIELLGLAADADRPVEALSLGRGRLVELGRALMIEPRLLLLDEPSSGLDTRETADMADVLERVRAERGLAMLLVEHDVAMVRRAAETLFVLDLGMIIASGPTRAVLADPRVRAAYLGEAVA